MRTLILLASACVALLLLQTLRAARGEGGASEAPAATRGDGPAPSTAPIAPPGREPARRIDAARPYRPLGAMERSLLQESHEEWRIPPAEFFDREMLPNDERAVAIAFLRGALRERGERRAPDGEENSPLLRAHLQPEGSLLVGTPEWRGDRLRGTDLAGHELAIPAAAIRSIEPVDEEAARSLRRAAFDSQVAALSLGGGDELTEAIERLLGIGDRVRAEARFPEWLAGGGPAALAAAETDPLRRERLITLAGRIAAVPAADAAETSPPSRGPRDLAALALFLDSPTSPRDLSPEARAARALECGLWSDWLAEHGEALPISAAERTALDQRLRLLRYDLLKAGGF